MGTVKTAVSLPENLFEQLEQLARELDVPRSRVVALALEALMRDRASERLLNQLNDTYSDGPSESERRWLEAGQQSFAHVVADEW